MLNYASIVRVGADLSRSAIQLHGVDASGGVVVAKRIPRSELIAWSDGLERGCVFAMESCCAAHHLARQLNSRGLTCKLISPSLVSPYRLAGVTGKNDANDAQAICEAASRPQMRFVQAKTVDQQAKLVIHRMREGYIKERTACVNRASDTLFEFGAIATLPVRGFPVRVADVLADEGLKLPGLARSALRRCSAHFLAIQKQIDWCDREIVKHVREDPNAKRALLVRGVGPIGASAIAASLGDLTQFSNARQFGAFLGLVPSQRSSGAKVRLGRITKRGDAYLRQLLVIGARSALAVAPKHDDAVSRWSVQLSNRVGWSKAIVGLANKNARILWSILSKADKTSTATGVVGGPALPAANRKRRGRPVEDQGMHSFSEQSLDGDDDICPESDLTQRLFDREN